MLCYCLRVEKKKKNQKVKTRGLQKKEKENQCLYQNVQCVILINQDLYKKQAASGLLIRLGIRTSLA